MKKIYHQEINNLFHSLYYQKKQINKILYRLLENLIADYQKKLIDKKEAKEIINRLYLHFNQFYHRWLNKNHLKPKVLAHTRNFLIDTHPNQAEIDDLLFCFDQYLKTDDLLEQKNKKIELLTNLYCLKKSIQST